MKFGLHLSTNLTPEWNSQYIQYEYMKEMLGKAVATAPVLATGDNDLLLEQYFLRTDETFFQYCEKQLTKINTFYAEKLAEALRRFETLKDEVQYRESLFGEEADQPRPSVAVIQETHDVGRYTGGGNIRRSRMQRRSAIKPANRILPERLLRSAGNQPNQHNNYKNTHDLRVAFSEFYLILVLLQKFQLLNFTGFRKILKKHDKLFETTRGEEWRKVHVDTATFYTSTAVTELIRAVETIYTNTFESGDRVRAMKRLRVTPLEEKQSRVVTFRVGIFLGIYCPLRRSVTIAFREFVFIGMLATLLPIIIILIVVLNKSRTGNALAWRDALHLYRSPFLIILQVILAGLNVYGWSSAGVNHILIFEIDPRRHLTYQQLLEIGTCLCVFWCFSFIAFIITSYVEFYPFLQPLIFVLLMIIFVINPMPILYRPARYWLLKTLGQVFSAAFHPIRFADNWLCNQLASVELAFFDLEFFFCFYFSNFHWWSTNLTLPSSTQNTFCAGWTKFLLQAFLLAIPSLLRFTQCVRRYYDTKLRYPHLLNAGKYVAGFSVAITNSLRRASNTLNKTYSENPTRNPFIYIWIITALINSTYKVVWDLKMDWGLFHRKAGKNRFLRDHIIYPSKKYYYYAIVQDIVLRYSWTINIFVQFRSGSAEYADVIGFSFGLVELLRRFSWNFFRLENEHLNNCGRFRAVRDISIKPVTTGINFAFIDSKLSKEPGIRSRRRAARSEAAIQEEDTAMNNDGLMYDSESITADFVKKQMSTFDATATAEDNEIDTTLRTIASQRHYSFSSVDNVSELSDRSEQDHQATTG